MIHKKDALEVLLDKISLMREALLIMQRALDRLQDEAVELARVKASASAASVSQQNSINS
jgi:hypothetical protein